MLGSAALHVGLADLENDIILSDHSMKPMHGIGSESLQVMHACMHACLAQVHWAWSGHDTESRHDGQQSVDQMRLILATMLL